MDIKNFESTLVSIGNVANIKILTEIEKDTNEVKYYDLNFTRGKYSFIGKALIDNTGHISRVFLAILINVNNIIPEEKINETVNSLNLNDETGCSFSIIKRESGNSILIKTSSRILRDSSYSKKESDELGRSIELSWRIILLDAITSLLRSVVTILNLKNENNHIESNNGDS